MPDETNTLQIEDARIIFRNFSGKDGKFNNTGKRTFCVVLPEDAAEAIAADGWNVKYLDAREEGEEPTPYLPVEVRYNVRPPRVVMITSTSRTNLGEHDIEVLDWADIKNVDLIVTPYEWQVNDKTGTKAYLKTMFITIEEDALERKYAINEQTNREDQ